jgi:hypothetical protein
MKLALFLYCDLLVKIVYDLNSISKLVLHEFMS